MISIPQSRTFFTFMNPLYLLLDNFWFYNYQDIEFGEVVDRTFTIMRLMNQVRLFPLPFYNFYDNVKSIVNLNSVTKTNSIDDSPGKFIQI